MHLQGNPSFDCSSRCRSQEIHSGSSTAGDGSQLRAAKQAQLAIKYSWALQTRALRWQMDSCRSCDSRAVTICTERTFWCILREERKLALWVERTPGALRKAPLRQPQPPCLVLLPLCSTLSLPVEGG